MENGHVGKERPGRPLAVSRRVALRLAAGAAGGLDCLPQWAAASHEEIKPFAGETFVGETKDPAAFVAVVIAEAQSDAGSREVRALVYGDPENEINEWFNAGSVGSGEVDLRGENGGLLTAGFTPDSVSGTIRLAGGLDLPFTAMPAQGTAGLYTLTASPDGLLRGDSAEGAHLQGQIDPTPLDGPPGDRARHLAVGLLTVPGAEPRAFALTVTAFPTDPISARFIVAADGRVKGGIDVHPMEIFKVDASVAIGR